ncbi:MMPL family protein [Polystyrenella longa]|uniref:MMPL family protein n=1 Tax=Polystyrenella longa TaxID=2528007 RepID=A0A518CH27_9PLAN|nr:MMPL family transporter [Polystyrenella longa]QDU78528.1 MMPL family protein [Polystyrenella longa]
MSLLMPPSNYEPPGWMRSGLRRLTISVLRQPKLTLGLVLASVIVSVGLTVGFLKFKTERSDLIDPSAPFHQRWLQYTESFGDNSDLVVVVEGETPNRIKQVLDELGQRLEARPEQFADVLYRVEPGRLQKKGLYYLQPEQLATGLERLEEIRPALEGNWRYLGLSGLLGGFSQKLSSTDATTQQQAVTELNQLLASLDHYLVDREDYQSPWPEVIEIDPMREQQANQIVYLLNDSGTMGFLKAKPVYSRDGFEGAAPVIDLLRELIADVDREYSDFEIGLTGIPVLESDEMRRSQADMIVASVISFLGVGLLLLIGFRGVRHPMIALAMLSVGLAWSFGYTTIAIGHLNILSVSFAVILIGLGIDFGIHYLSRYLQYRHEKRPMFSSLVRTSESVGPGIITAALTTSLAFACATFTPFLGIAELGLIAAGGILLCALVTFIVIPPLVAFSDQKLLERRLPSPYDAARFRRLLSRHPIPVAVLSLSIITGIGASAFTPTAEGLELNVKYDYNLLNLQADGLESVETQKRIFQKAKDSLLFAVSLADSPEQALVLKQQFEQLPSVAHVQELASQLPPHSAEKTQLLVQGYRALLNSLPSATPVLPPPSLQQVEQLSLRIDQQLGQAFDSEKVLSTRRLLRQVWNRLAKLTQEQQVDWLAQFQQRNLQSLLFELNRLYAVSDPDPVSVADFPDSLSSRFLSPDGKWLLQVYPKEQVWDIEPLTQFVEDVRTVDPLITGTPLQNYEAAQQISESYQIAAFYSLAVICLVLLIDFLEARQKWAVFLTPMLLIGIAALFLPDAFFASSPLFLISAFTIMSLAFAFALDPHNSWEALLAMFPPLAGGLLMFGLMALLGVDLNPANLIVLPLVLGIGVDDGVHVIHDFRMNPGRYKISASTLNAVVLTSFTSMIGFGSMMVAAHRGLYSVGQVLVIGIGSCMFVSLVALPAILTIIDQYRTPDEKAYFNSDEEEGTIPFSSGVA